jgi:hypothetical protein
MTIDCKFIARFIPTCGEQVRATFIDCAMISSPSIHACEHLRAKFALNPALLRCSGTRRANLSRIDWNKIARRGYVSFTTTDPPHESPTCNIRERQMPISQALQLLFMQPQAREPQRLPPMRLIEPTFAPHKI